jgi:hypothetical protein
MQIKAGIYTHILVSLELLTARQFRTILNNAQIRNLVK